MNEWSWKNEDDLMDALNDIQNSNKFWNKDITTIVGFFTSRQELVEHINRNGVNVK